MTGGIPRLRADQLWTALEDVDPVPAVIGELTRGGPDAGLPARLIRQDAADGEELVLLEETCTGTSCLLPAQALRAFRAAALTTVAARELLTPGIVIAGVVGSNLAAQVQLAALTRCLSDVSHVALHVPEKPAPIESRLLDQFELAGIGFTATTDVREAVLGANLIVALGGCGGLDGAGRPAEGALLVNASGRDLARQVVDHVDEIYVDDASLLAAHAHRYSVQPHRGALPRIAGDLREVLAAGPVVRRSADAVLLVEVLSADVLDVELAWKVHRAAMKRGFR